MFNLPRFIGNEKFLDNQLSWSNKQSQEKEYHIYWFNSDIDRVILYKIIINN